MIKKYAVEWPYWEWGRLSCFGYGVDSWRVFGPVYGEGENGVFFKLRYGEEKIHYTGHPGRSIAPRKNLTVKFISIVVLLSKITVILNK